jgi:Kef-type K+ transport system membrane component KefB
MPQSWYFSSLLAEIAAKSDSEIETIALDVILLTISLIFLVSKIGAEICVKLKLPAVLGELIAGVIIGVSGAHLLVFGIGDAADIPNLWQDFLHNIYGLNQADALRVFDFNEQVVSLLSDIGVIVLLFEVGLESNLVELLSVGPQALIVATVGVIVPFALGTLGLIYGFSIPLIPAVFAGAALTATSIGITAKVLGDMGQLKTTEGQIIIGAAVVDDIFGIVILAVVASLIKTGQVRFDSIIYLMLIAVVFLVGAIVVGRIFTRFIVAIVDRMQTRGQLLIPALIFAFLLAYIAHRVGLETIIGSFAAGLVLAETDKGEELRQLVAPVVDLIVPIFFVCVGAKTDLGALNFSDREGLILAIFLVLVAIIGKLATSVSLWNTSLNKLAVGVGMIPRGEVGLVFASIGSATDLVPDSIIAAIIMMIITTTFITPSWLRLVLKKSEQEQLT